MAASLGSKRQAMLLGALAVVLLLAVVRWRSGGGGRAGSPDGSATGHSSRVGDADGADAASPARGRRPATREVSPDEVPILSVKDLGPPPARRVGDSGRDLFDLREPTRPPPPTPTPAPPAAGEAAFIGPPPPPTPTPTPKPPEITFKFLGTFGPREHPIAVIQQGEQVFNARAGDTLFGKFVLRRVGYESIDVGFVGFSSSETKRLGITP